MIATETPIEMLKRPRRNRKSASIRELVQETRLAPGQLVAPLFVIDGDKHSVPIESLPGVSRLSIDLLIKEVEKLYELGIRAIDIFPVIDPKSKDSKGSDALNPKSLVYRAIAAVKKNIPEMCVMVDVALDPYTDHGHDGLVDHNGYIINDDTIEVLTAMSVLSAEHGADVIAPSDMMDGRVKFIRQSLDLAGFSQVNILSYTAKYASAFYGPFRDALSSAPKFGDKKGYQMNPANIREALLEAKLDEEEGADMLMIKPALAYLDVIAKIREISHLPIAAYHVSGEYAMVKAAARNGWIDENRIMMECLISIRRAGADFIFTYAAAQIAALLNSK
jgi:porphobilinogen synthase